jgi:hypothetical protein
MVYCLTLKLSQLESLSFIDKVFLLVLSKVMCFFGRVTFIVETNRGCHVIRIWRFLYSMCTGLSGTVMTLKRLSYRLTIAKYSFRMGSTFSKCPSDFNHHQVIGPSGVRALPLAAVINVGGHYTWHFFLSLSLLLFFLPAHC